MPLVTRFSSLALILIVSAATTMAQKNDDWTKMSEPKSVSREIKHKEKIEATYDKFKDITFVQLQNMEVGLGVYLGAIASAKGSFSMYPVPARVVLLTFSLHNESWRCLDGCEVTFLVNGERIGLGVADNLSRQIVERPVYCNRWGCDTPRPSVIERISMAVPYETFKKIALADSVEFQAGTDEARLKDGHRAALGDFASRIQP